MNLRFRRATLIILCLSGFVCLVAVLLKHEERVPLAGLGLDMTDRRSSDAELYRGASSAPRAVTPPGLSQQSIHLKGRVVDELFELPIRALVTTGIGEHVFSDGRTGSFELAADGNAPLSIKATAPGYESLNVPVPAQNSVGSMVLRLRASQSASVIVQDASGLPVPRAAVAWRACVREFRRENTSNWIDDGGEPAGRALELKTDLLGVSRADIALPAIATITDPRSGARVSVRIAPGEERRVTFAERPVALEFTDGVTFAPVRDLELDVWYPRESASVVAHARTNENGLVFLAPISFPILVRSSGLAVWERVLRPKAPEITLTGFGGTPLPILRIDRMPAASEPSIIECSACGGRLRLLDDVSGSPITALARLGRCESSRMEQVASSQPSRCTIYSARDARADTGGTVEVRDGILSLPCTLSHIRALDKSAQSEWTITIAVRGYSPVRVAADHLPWGIDDSELEIRLKPVPPRSLLVLDGEGHPFRQTVAIYSSAGDMITWQSLGSDDGRHGPFDWLGGDLLVQLGDEGAWERRIRAADLAASEIFTLRLQTRTGTLMVDGIPPAADPYRLVAKLGIGFIGTLNVPSVVENGSCRFDALPPGHYLVGPGSWVDGAEWQTQEQKSGTMRMTPRPSRAWVRENEVTHVPWLDVWEAGRVIEGRVRVKGPGAVDLFLVPFFGAVGPAAEEQPGEIPHMVFGRRSFRLPLDRDGRYKIGEHESLPRLLVVCSTDDGTWGTTDGLHVLETMLPGESLDLQLGSLRLTDKNSKRTEQSVVTYEVLREGLRHPLSTFHHVSRNNWLPHSTLQLDGIPLTVRQIVIDGHARPIELNPHEVVTIEIE